MWNDKKVLAVIPARGGSKGIPRKNLSLVGGRSLLSHAVDIVNQASWIDHAILSTDDIEIANHGLSLGIPVPFMRPAEFAGDYSNSIDMWRNVLLMAEGYYHQTFDYSILLEPTCPLRSLTDVERTIAKLENNKFDAAVTVSKTPAHFAPEKTLKINSSGNLDFFTKGGDKFSIRQNIPNYFHRNGACYAAKRKLIFEGRSLIGNYSASVLIERELVNVDTFFDLSLANFLFSKLKETN